jgi:hypothetical protein
MAQRVANGFERDALLEQSHGKGMPQDMRSAWGQVQPAALEAMRQYLANRGRLQRAAGSNRAQEQLAMGTFGPGLAQIADQYVGRLIREGQLKRLPGLGLHDPQRATPPVNVVERQTNQFPTP